MVFIQGFVAAALAGGAVAQPVQQRSTTPAVVNFANNTGVPQQLASGLLYGLPNKRNQIPVSDETRCG